MQRVLVNQNTGCVVDGHLRVAMAIREGVEEIPVTYLDLSEEEEGLVLATLDNVTAMAGTDEENLNVLLEEVRASEPAQDNEDVAYLLDLIRENAFRDGIKGGESPDAFQAYDEDIETTHECPRCGYSWS